MPAAASDELSRVAELRAAVADDLTLYYDTHFNLARWLQGHPNSPIADIAGKLAHHLKLRKSSWDLDRFSQRPRGFHQVHHHWPHGMTAESKALPDVLVNIEQCGRVDFEGMLATFSITEVMKARIWDLEEMLSLCMSHEKKTGRQASVLYVMDLDGLEYNKKLVDLVLGSMRSLSEFMAEHYVELMKEKSEVLSSIFLHVRILGTGSWRKEILELADVASLPDYWNDDNHTFHAKVARPSNFPPTPPISPTPTGAGRISLRAGCREWLPFDLRAGDSISWHITGSQNFGFAVLGPANHDDFTVVNEMLLDQVFPMFPWMPGPTVVPLEESVVIPADGHYCIWLSNARAWWHTLQLSVWTEVTRKGQEDSEVANTAN